MWDIRNERMHILKMPGYFIRIKKKPTSRGPKNLCFDFFGHGGKTKNVEKLVLGLKARLIFLILTN